MDGINLGEKTGPADDPHSSNSELELDLDFDKSSSTNKAMELNINIVEELCEACIESKHTRIVKSIRMILTTKRLQKIHADLWRPDDPTSILGKNYVALLLNEFTRKSWIILRRSKDEIFDTFKLWLPRVKACKGGGEFINIALQSFCEEQRIKIGYAAPYMHDDNGIAEQYWRTLALIKNSLLIDSKLSNQFWAKVMDTANYLQNRLPTRCTADKIIIISEEAWTRVKQNLEHIRIFGNKVSTYIPSEKHSKSNVYKPWNGIFLGYTDTTKYLGTWAPKTHQMLIASKPVVNE